MLSPMKVQVGNVLSLADNYDDYYLSISIVDSKFDCFIFLNFFNFCKFFF